MKFAHLEYDKNVYDWQGSQIPFIGFDELTHFTERQFFYMLSRNRSTSGVPGYIRATCNPDADSWVRDLIDWWIGEDGFPLAERSGVLRWFIRKDEKMIWGDSAEELQTIYGADERPKSLTFIPSNIRDNKILMDKDPAYLANLMAQSRVERARLLGGNWNVRETAGEMFQQEWFPTLEVIPGGWIDICRAWDRAATKPNEKNKDPDWTRGVLIYKYPNGTFLVASLISLRDTPGQVEKIIKNAAAQDTYATKIRAQRDPGSAGVAEAENFVRMLPGYDVGTEPLSQNKIARAKPVSAQAEAGNIYVLKAPWNKEFYAELENFPEGGHDDIVDALSLAFNSLAGGLSIADVS